MRFRVKYLGFILIAIIVVVVIREGDSVQRYVISKLRLGNQVETGPAYDAEFETKCAEYSKLAHQALTFLPNEVERCGEVLEQMTEVLDKTPEIDRKEYSSRRRQMKTLLGFVGYACVEISRRQSFEKAIERREALSAPDENTDPETRKADEDRIKKEIEVLRTQIASSEVSTKRAIADSEFMLEKVDRGLKLKP